MKPEDRVKEYLMLVFPAAVGTKKVSQATGIPKKRAYAMLTALAATPVVETPLSGQFRWVPECNR